MNLNLSNLQSNVINSCFLVSFLTTIYYWVNAIFFSKKNKNSLQGNTQVDIEVNQSFGNHQFFFQKTGFICCSIINILLIIELSIRWIQSGHFPLSSLYESLLFLAWGIISFYLFIEYFIQNELIGVVVSPLVLCILAFSSFSLPSELQEIKSLVPALQSNWLFMHVSVMMLSYAGLLLGSILAITYLVLNYFFIKKFSSISHNIQVNSNNEVVNSELAIGINKTLTKMEFGNFTKKGTFFGPNQQFLLKSPNPLTQTSTHLDNLLTIFDNLSYRTIGIGFCFLTLGILSGAVWANETWGTYWSWDPKETWALITWLTFAAYLHMRLLYGWEGFKPALIASLGFLLIWVCYLGVNLLGKGLHTYGFLNS
jgi:cytochrome c-type biogenesis protein CcsB